VAAAATHWVPSLGAPRHGIAKARHAARPLASFSTAATSWLSRPSAAFGLIRRRSKRARAMAAGQVRAAGAAQLAGAFGGGVQAGEFHGWRAGRRRRRGASQAEPTAAIGCKDASWLHAWPCCSLSLDRGGGRTRQVRGRSRPVNASFARLTAHSRGQAGVFLQNRFSPENWRETRNIGRFQVFRYEVSPSAARVRDYRFITYAAASSARRRIAPGGRSGAFLAPTGRSSCGGDWRQWIELMRRPRK